MAKGKFIAIGSILLMMLVIFTGCNFNKYHAEMYSTSENLVLSTFLEDNKVRGSYYKNPDYIDGEDDPADEYYYDESSPKSRTFIIDDQETFDSIFIKDKFQVDFSKKTVYLYIFADVNPSLEYYVYNVSVEEETVNIYFKLRNSNKKGSTSPYQRCLIVIMDKTDTSNVEFIKQK